MHSENFSGNYRDLKVWCLARDLAIEVGNLCRTPKFLCNRVLSDQMQRLSISVPSNIAEGNDRSGNKDTIRFLVIARGSLAELRTQLDIALGLKLFNEQQHQHLDTKCAEAGRMLSGLIKFKRNQETPSGGSNSA